MLKTLNLIALTDSVDVLPLVWLNYHMDFEWDLQKDTTNIEKHGVSFSEAQRAFLDPKRVIAIDVKHSTPREKRYFCFGKVVENVMTVRFTHRAGAIRIFGAGYWREGRRKYEQENSIS
mgnify:CR=1 FL=1